MTLLPLTPADIDRTLEMMARFYAHEHLGYDRGRARKALEDLAAAPEFGGVWLIGAEGEVAGYLVLTIGYSLEYHGRFALLDEFYLEPEWRGRGAGTEALRWVADWARRRGVKVLRLEVDRQNRARDLYERSGFETLDRYLMKRAL